MRRASVIWGEYRKDRRGAVALEAAFILPFLLIGGIGAIDASYLMLQNHKMEAGLANAASYLARSPDPAAHEMLAKRLAVSGRIGTGGRPVLRDWNPSDIAITYKSVANAGGNYRGGTSVKTVTLTSSKSFDGFGVLKSVFGGSITIQARHEQRLVGTLT